MKLTLKEGQEIAKKLKSSNVQAVVGEILDKVMFYVYSVDPAIKCNCCRKEYDVYAKGLVENQVAKYENVRIALSGPAVGR